MEIDVSPAQIEDKPVLRNMLQLYLYDFSEFGGWDLGVHGLYDYPYLDHYWTEPNRHPFLIRVDGHLAGFALVSMTPSERGAEIGFSEFFVLRKYRRQGVGETVAHTLFARYPGSWAIEELETNVVAQRFWRKVIGRYVDGAYRERHDTERGRIIQEFTVP